MELGSGKSILIQKFVVTKDLYSTLDPVLKAWNAIAVLLLALVAKPFLLKEVVKEGTRPIELLIYEICELVLETSLSTYSLVAASVGSEGFRRDVMVLSFIRIS